MYCFTRSVQNTVQGIEYPLIHEEFLNPRPWELAESLLVLRFGYSQAKRRYRGLGPNSGYPRWGGVREQVKINLCRVT